MKASPFDFPEQIGLIDGFFASWVRRGMWIQLTCAACGQSVQFAKPTARKVEWYMSVHRCERPEGDFYAD